MNNYKIIVSERFHSGVKNTISYIKNNLDSPYTADSILELIENTIRSLSVMPERYGLVNDPYLKHKGFRKCLIKNYLLFYKIDNKKDTIFIHRLLHTKQNWLTFL